MTMGVARASPSAMTYHAVNITRAALSGMDKEMVEKMPKEI